MSSPLGSARTLLLAALALAAVVMVGSIAFLATNGGSVDTASGGRGHGDEPSGLGLPGPSRGKPHKSSTTTPGDPEDPDDEIVGWDKSGRNPALKDATRKDR